MSSAFLVGGYAAAAMILKVDPGFSPILTTTYDHNLPDDFPLMYGET